MSLFEQIFTHSGRRYFVISLSVLLTVGLLASYLLQADYQQQYRYAQQRNMKLEQQIVTLNQKVIALPDPVISTSITVQPPFSIIDMLRKSGGQLIRWQPDKPRSMLELLLSWDNVPYFFEHIASYQGINLHAFTLSGIRESMCIVLTLEFSHENK